MKEYKIRFMNDGEFEALSLVNPRYANTKDDLGFADMQTNRIFVRKTGIKPLDTFTTVHEIEEILAKNSAHQDEFNIRHKKVFKEIILPILAPVVGGLLGGPIGAGLLGGVGGAAVGSGLGAAGGSAIQQAATTGKVQALPTVLSGLGGALGGAGMSPGIEASKAAGGGIIGQTLSGAQSTLGFQSGAQKTLATTGAGTAASPFQANPIYVTPGATMQETMTPAQLAAAGAGSAFGKITSSLGAPTTAQGLGFQAPVTGATPAQAQTLGTTTPAKVGAEAALPTGGVGTTGVTGAGAGAGGAGAGQVTSKTPMLEKILGANWRQTVLGASIPLLGQSMMGQPMFPPGSENVPFTPEQSQLFQETAQMVREGPKIELAPNQQQAITSSYDTALEQARQNIIDMYKKKRPGSDIETDSNMREALVELESEFAEKRANALASAQLGLGAQQTQMLGELANMEIGVLSQKAGISYAESRDFKNMLAQLGYMVSTAGQPIIYTGSRY